MDVLKAIQDLQAWHLAARELLNADTAALLAMLGLAVSLALSALRVSR